MDHIIFNTDLIERPAECETLWTASAQLDLALDVLRAWRRGQALLRAPREAVA
jgi:hypothetical protein